MRRNSSAVQACRKTGCAGQKKVLCGPEKRCVDLKNKRPPVGIHERSARWRWAVGYRCSGAGAHAVMICG